MTIEINAKQLRTSLPEVVRRVKKRAKFAVIYRSRPAFKIVPVDDAGEAAGALADDPIYHAPAVGRSKDGRGAVDHDDILYPR
jgi:antitoxin (DNA-binding transcriptional repressor) of toxin-antitoxin stability system